jgi:hypothetical protein
VVCNFQSENNKIILQTEYESVTDEVLLLLESVLQNAKTTSIFHKHLVCCLQFEKL